jgi:hypothetical protein
VPPPGLEADLTDLHVSFEAERAKTDARYADDLTKAAGDAEKVARAERDHAKRRDDVDAKYSRDRAKLVAKAKRLAGGDKELDLRLVMIRSDHPVEPDQIVLDAGTPVHELAPD